MEVVAGTEMERDMVSPVAEWYPFWASEGLGFFSAFGFVSLVAQHTEVERICKNWSNSSGKVSATGVQGGRKGTLGEVPIGLSLLPKVDFFSAGFGDRTGWLFSVIVHLADNFPRSGDSPLPRGFQCFSCCWLV